MGKFDLLQDSGFINFGLRQQLVEQQPRAGVVIAVDEPCVRQ
jgi:hypothetical protein